MPVKIKVVDNETGLPLQRATLQFVQITATNDLPIVKKLEMVATDDNGEYTYNGTGNAVNITNASYKQKNILLSGYESITARMEPDIKESSVTITANKKSNVWPWVLLLAAIGFISSNQNH